MTIVITFRKRVDPLLILVILLGVLTVLLPLIVFCYFYFKAAEFTKAGGIQPPAKIRQYQIQADTLEIKERISAGFAFAVLQYIYTMY